MKVAILGLGEVGSQFANDLAKLNVTVFGWDPNPKRELHPSIMFTKSNADAVRQSEIIFSVNLSSVSEAVAREVLPVLTDQKIYLEMNTASPKKKISINQLLKPSGVQFVDLAIMAPVPPKGIKTPFLISGNGAKLFHEKLRGLKLDIEVLSENVGDASTKKLLRSIVYKGVAAVICEAVEAGQSFGLEQFVWEQIHAVIGGNDELINRFIEGSKTHAERRIHEMEAVVNMLEENKVEPIISKATCNNLKKIKNKNEKVTDAFFPSGEY